MCGVVKWSFLTLLFLNRKSATDVYNSIKYYYLCRRCGDSRWNRRRNRTLYYTVPHTLSISESCSNITAIGAGNWTSGPLRRAVGKRRRQKSARFVQLTWMLSCTAMGKQNIKKQVSRYDWYANIFSRCQVSGSLRHIGHEKELNKLPMPPEVVAQIEEYLRDGWAPQHILKKIQRKLLFLNC